MRTAWSLLLFALVFVAWCVSTVRDTGRLWVAGVPGAGRSALVGVSGYPVLGRIKLGKA